MKRGSRSLALLLAIAGLASCGGEEAKPTPAVPVVVAPKPVASGPADVLGPRPTPAPPAPYTPPAPVVYKHPRGMTVWLLERHGLPVVSIETVVPAGSKNDPDGKAGVVWATANMLDEGAGTRGPLEIARDIDLLGASLSTGATTDYSFASLTVLKKNLAQAAAIYGDVLAKPRFSPTEWARVHKLWLNDLAQRKKDPGAVASVVVRAKVFGPDTAYGHPTDGTEKSASGVKLADVKALYDDRWHPDYATCVVVGDVTRAELDPLLDSALSAWKPGNKGWGEGYGERAVPPGLHVVVVDRPDAPQSVIAVGRKGARARDLPTAPLTRVNEALGGSFTSRLNQDLREEHGWSYGARSSFSFNQMRGIFVAQAAVYTEHTGEALKAMLDDVKKLAGEGLTDDEVEKTRLLARSALVQSFERVESTAGLLSRDAALGLPADFEAKRGAVVDGATKDHLDRLAAQYLDLSAAVAVIVGPRAKVEPQLKAIGIDSVESSDPEGR